jgi:type VI protein secretion system component Hcp
VTLKGVIISSYSSSGGHGAVPGETVCLNFSEVQYEYSPQKKTGSLDGSVQGGWKLKEREVVA